MSVGESSNLTGLRVEEEETTPSSLQQDRSLDEWIREGKRKGLSSKKQKGRTVVRYITKRASRVRLATQQSNSGSSRNQGTRGVTEDIKVQPVVINQ